ncbi:hypothetical protein B0H11DRAFT_2229399 [Mycena galericulata]|nr:hypothetical protein B0H11DRAFT_2229399 [Mycena galericulata]
MSSMILLFLALAVSGFEVDVDALFSGPDFASMNYVGRSYNNSGTLRKRYDQARFTFFDTGLGACGTTNSPSDFIVALNSPQYGNGEHCYEMIQISYGGKSATAQIVDECPGCPWGQGRDIQVLGVFWWDTDADVVDIRSKSGNEQCIHFGAEYSDSDDRSTGAAGVGICLDYGID